MSNTSKCSFYRSPQSIAVGIGLGYCDIDGDQTICDGDVQFCKDPEVLRKRLLERKSREASNQKGEEGQKKKPSSYRILVVDDEEPMRNMMLALLSRLGHQCITASNGIEALNKTKQSKVDAVVTDIVMPGMDGIALTKEMLVLYPNLPIMVMTGHAQEYSFESAITAGARDFIKKPFSIEEFMLRLKKMIRDYEISCRVEAEQNERVFHLKRKSSEEISELKREIESLKSKLYSAYGGSLR
jgi:CheY-like chemotaxis protein